MGVLEVKASRFQATEQGFHLPAAGMSVEGFGLGYTRGGDEEELAIVQAQRGEVDEAAPVGTATRQPMALAGREIAKSSLSTGKHEKPVSSSEHPHTSSAKYWNA